MKQKNQNQYLSKSLIKIEKIVLLDAYTNTPKSQYIQNFNDILMPTLEKISKENKDAYLMGDFNINLINYNSHNPT